MELFGKINNGWKPLNITDDWLVSEQASAVDKDIK